MGFAFLALNCAIRLLYYQKIRWDSCGTFIASCISYRTREYWDLTGQNPFPWTGLHSCLSSTLCRIKRKIDFRNFFEMCITSHTCFHFEYPIQVWEDFWGCFINFEFMCLSLTMSSSFLTLMIHLSDFGCKVFFPSLFSALCVKM